MISHDELVWHKRCRLVVNSNAVKRANKRKLEEPNHIPMKTRNTSSTADMPSFDYDDEKESPCFICDEIGEQRWGGCHKAETLGVNNKVWLAAKLLGESN